MKALLIMTWFLITTILTSSSMALLFPHNWLDYAVGASAAPGVVSPATLLPLGSLIAGIGITIAATWRIATWTTEQSEMRKTQTEVINRLQSEVSFLRERVAKLEDKS